MKIAYFDCFSGASGDMILGALVDAGLPLSTLREQLAGLGVPGWEISGARIKKAAIAGTKVDVSCDTEEKTHRHLSHIAAILHQSNLSTTVKEKSLAIFTRLAEAEARVHGTTVETIHFHEVGAVDAIVDIVGAVIGLETLGVEAVYCSALHVGCGTVDCAHGTLPVPAPATAELVRGVPIYSTGVSGELLTPTGAAILTTLARGFGACPEMEIQSIGYGAGNAERALPNLVRVSIGEVTSLEAEPEAPRVAVIESAIDDLNPQVYEHLMDRLLGESALDVYLTPVQMKKNRPGTLLTVLCAPDRIQQVAEIIIRETTTIGLRWRLEDRIVADRRIFTVETAYGPVRIKAASMNGQVVNLSPEYEDCRRIAQESGVALKQVMEAARRAAAEDEGPLIESFVRRDAGAQGK